MDTLQQLLISAFEKQMTIERAIHWIIVKKLRHAGIELDDEQLEKLTIKLGEERTDDNTSTVTIEFDLEDDLLEGQIETVFEGDAIIITLEDVKAFETTTNQAIGEMVHFASKEISQHFFNTWTEIAPHELTQQRKKEAEYNKKIFQIWGSALEKLKLLLSVSLDAGQTFNNDYRPVAVKDNDMVFDALVRLHARGCQVGHEILVLLTHGLADGALARWRTLHEISIIADFINQHGQDVAERYLLHQHIDTYKGMAYYQEHCQALGMKPYPKRWMKRAKQMNDDLIVKYGKSYKGDYGWAAAALGESNPHFTDIEENVGLERLRPYVQLSHHHVHATSRGNFHLLASPKNSDILIAGPSIFGLYDPGVQTAYSTTYLLSTVLLSISNLDHLAIVQGVMQIEKEVFAAFADALEASEAEGK